MSRISLTLSRTVFLPVGSPPIGSVCDIRADIGKADIHVENGQIYCLGDLDLLIDYMSFAPGEIGRLFTGHSADQHSGEGREWQALLNLPFVLNEKTELAPDLAYEAAVGDLKWFMVAPRALEMEIQVFITEEQVPAQAPGIGGVIAQKRGGGWQMTNEEERVLALSDEIPLDADGLPQPSGEIFDGEMMAQMVAGTSPAPEFVSETESEQMLETMSETESEQMLETMSETESEQMLEPMVEPEREPEIVRIVFNEDAPIDEEGIKQAIARAKAEAAAKRAAQAGFIAENAPAAEPVAMAEPIMAEAAAQELPEPLPMAAQEIPAPPAARKARRGYGLPKLDIDAKNNNFELSALNFNINIKIP